MTHAPHRLVLGGAALLVLVGMGCVYDVAPRPDGDSRPQERPDRGATDEPFSPAAARLRRLLAFQYTNAIADLLGPEAAAVVEPPDDVPLNGFAAVGAATLSLSPLDVERIEASAFAAASAAMTGSAQGFRVCAPAAFDDAACAEQTVAAFGRRAFRRPLTSEELARWRGVLLQAATATGDFSVGVELAIAGMLQSPHFIYLVEAGEPVADDPARRRLTGHEMASRLSFFLAGTTPDEGLLLAAERGELDTPEGLALHAAALLDGPRARGALRAFFSEKLGLWALPRLSRPDPEFTAAVRAAMQEEALRFVDDVVWDRNADARELFTGAYTFVNDTLAGYYGLPLPGQGDTFVRVDLAPSSGRRGLLTQGAFLARFAHDNRSSPTLRGKFIRESLMCQAVPAPPGDVNTVLPEPADDDLPRTTRDRLAAHVEEPSCAGCHSMMDPLGFAFEGFDQVGRRRTHERGLPVDTATDVDGAPVADAAALGAAVASYPDVPACLVKNLFRHGVGHIEERGEDPSLALATFAFEDAGWRLRDALLAIVTSDAFRFVAQPEGVQ